jgi:2-polyprenyl-6-methoxyphenol hydroxylase-like FAD-dependent oxidoreductase
LHWLMRDILVPLDNLKSLVEKGVFMIGDAGHATPILGGEGVDSVIADAVELAEWISSQGVEGVGEFNEKRFGEWERGVKESEEKLKSMHLVSRYLL